MSPPGSGAAFRTTSWTLILRARSSPADREALLRAYCGPIGAYLKRKLRNVDDAEELTQEFIHKKVLEGNLLKKADRERGRFRDYLLASLDRFVIDWHRKTHGRPGDARPDIALTSDEAVLESAGTRQGDDPVAAYNKEFARAVLDQVRQRLEEDCRRCGLNRHWTAYEARVLRPLLYGSEPATVESLALMLGATAPEVSHMIETVRRKSVKVLREVVADTLENPGDVDDEIDALWRYVADRR